MGQKPFRCSACDYTQYFSPFTAVGALIVDADDHMLFIVRAKAPGVGKLGLPGGFVDAGETAEQALVREVLEELNLTLVHYNYLASFPNEYAFRGIKAPVTDLFFVAQVATFDDIKAQAGEVSEWRFRPAASVSASELAFDTHQQALDAYLGRNS